MAMRFYRENAAGRHIVQSRNAQFIDIFSDTVLQKVYEKLEFLEHRSVPTCMVFRCLPDKIDLIVMQRKPESSIDLSTAESIHQVLMSDLNSITFYTSSRAYVSEREMEIHQLLEQGCLLSSSDFWVQLNAIVEINRTDHN